MSSQTAVPPSGRLVAAASSRSNPASTWAGSVDDYQKKGNYNDDGMATIDDDGMVASLDADGDAPAMLGSRRESPPASIRQSASWFHSLWNLRSAFTTHTEQPDYHADRTGEGADPVRITSVSTITTLTAVAARNWGLNSTGSSSQQRHGGDAQLGDSGLSHGYNSFSRWLSGRGDDDDDDDSNNDGSSDETKVRNQSSHGDGRYNGDDEGLHDINCSLFEGWADMPEDCREQTDTPSGSPTQLFFGIQDDGQDEQDVVTDDTVGDGQEEESVTTSPTAEAEEATFPPESYPATDPDTDRDPVTDDDTATSAKLPGSPKPSNVLSLQLSMGIIGLHNLTEDEANLIVTMCLRAMTIILNSHSPFAVVDVLDVPPPPLPENNDNGSRGLSEERQVNGKSSRDRSEDRRQSSKTEQDRALEEDQAPPEAKLFLQDVYITESDHMQEWFILTSGYAAFWPDGETIESDFMLNEVTSNCTQVLSVAIDHRDFWAALESLHFGQDLLMPHPPYDSDDAGLADCRVVGDEYELVPHDVEDGVEDISWNGTMSSPTDVPLFDATDGPTWNYTPDATYDTVLGHSVADLVWEAREWVGLGLMTATLLVSILLSLIAVRLEQKRTRDQMWGILTEDGVGEMLQVGWRYQQETVVPDGAGAPQLFLQIFDKGKLGYNDANSMLQGGVERNELGLFVEQQPISSTSATSTPPTSIARPPNATMSQSPK